MSRKLIINAVNINNGGGAALLTPVLQNLPAQGFDVVAILDERMRFYENSIPQGVTINRVPPTFIKRLRSEWRIYKEARAGDLILCFGNLPLLFNSAGRVNVFLQNRYLIENVPLRHFPFKTKVRLWMERLWLSARLSSVDEFIVQTPSMQRLLESRTKSTVPVRVLPFMDNAAEYSRRLTGDHSVDAQQSLFAYVASGEPHKNHRVLVSAWCLLAQGHLYPSLKLTVDRQSFPDLCKWIDTQVTQYGLNITNEGKLSSEAVSQLYSLIDALIYPSVFESFGLPLIEARQAGLPILASELDFVRDVLDPEETFDPTSPLSVARAVKRFLQVEEQALPLQDAEGFIEHLVKTLR